MISRWKRRYEEDGLLGLATVHPGQPLQRDSLLIFINHTVRALLTLDLTIPLGITGS